HRRGRRPIMPSREISKNRRDMLRITPSRYEGYDLIDIRVYSPKPGTRELVPTKKGVSVAVDLVPTLIDALIWALGQACDTDPASPERRLSSSDLDRLAQLAWSALKRHGSPVHWDMAERIVLTDHNQFSKWDLHYVLATRNDLFERTD